MIVPRPWGISLMRIWLPWTILSSRLTSKAWICFVQAWVIPSTLLLRIYDALYQVSMASMRQAATNVLLLQADFGPKECKCMNFPACGEHEVKMLTWCFCCFVRSAEYLAQSGVMASLLKQQREESQGAGTSVRIQHFLHTKWLSSSKILLISSRLGRWMSSAAYVPFSR